MSNALNNAAKLAKVVNALEPRFGITPGVVNTTGVQNVLDEAAAIGGTAYFPGAPGQWYLAEQLTIPAVIRVMGDNPWNSGLKQASGVNDHFITIPYTLVTNPIIENLTIDGNRNGNTSAGHGIYLEDHDETDPNVIYGFAVVMRNAYVQNVREECLHIGANRNMGHIENCEFKRGGKLLVVDGSSDWRFMHGRFAFPLDGIGVDIGNCADMVFVGSAMYGALAFPMVKLGTTSSSPSKIIGCTINGNQREGLLIQGSSGIARSVGHIIHGNWFAENGLETDNTYSHIRCTDTSGASFSQNNFRYSGSGNKCKYLLETTGAAGYHQWVGNTWDQTSAPYGTAISNNNAYLRARMESLAVEGTSYLGAATNDLTANSLRVVPGVSGGNYMQAQGRAAGTGPDITAQGVDDNINWRASSKGTGNLEFWTGSLARRVLRLMNVANSVNRIDVYPSASGSPVQLAAAGETNVDVQVTPAGSGVFRIPIANVPNYSDDTAAAAGGVPVGGEYRNGSVKMIRVT